jgi:hypothetical protein
MGTPVGDPDEPVEIQRTIHTCGPFSGCTDLATGGGLDLSRCVETQVAVLVETALAESAGRGIEPPTRRADAADEVREASGRWRSLRGDGARGKRCV